MEAEDLTDRFLVEFPGIGRHVEVEVAAEQLVRPLTTEHHLDAHGLDLPRHEEHGRGRPYGGHVIRFDVPDHLGQGVDALLYREGQAVVHGADGFRHFRRRCEVRGTIEADGEAVDAGPPRFGVAFIVHPPCRLAHGDGSDDGAVQST